MRKINQRKEGETGNEANLLVSEIIVWGYVCCGLVTIILIRYNYHEYCYPNEDRKGWGQAVRFMNWKAVR